MKTSGRFIKSALEYVTQCFLLPGVALDIEQVFLFYAQNVESMLSKKKRIQNDRNI